MPKKKKSVTDLVFSALKGDSPSTQKHRKKNKKLQNFVSPRYSSSKRLRWVSAN